MKALSGTNQRALRCSNNSTLLYTLYFRGAQGRATLAQSCGLTRPAITILLRQLLERGAVVESGETLQRNNSGRRERLVELNYTGFTAVSVNIERDKVHLSLSNLHGTIVERIIPTEALLAAQNKAAYLAEQVKTLPDYSLALGVGVGVIGEVDADTGCCKDSHGLLPQDYALGSLLQAELNLPVFVCNNVRAQAMAIVSDVTRDFVYVKHGVGIGAAIVMNGEVLRGENNRAGEAGAIPIGGGTLEQRLNEKTLLEEYVALGGNVDSAAELYERYGKEQTATRLLSAALKDLGGAIVGINALLNPQKIMVSGGIFNCHETLARLNDVLAQHGHPPVNKIASAGEIKYLAGARMVFDKLFFNQPTECAE